MAVRMQNKTLIRLLTKLKACPEAVRWVGKQDLKTAWAKCERADWMLWLAGKMVGKRGWPIREQLVLAACACAETVLPIFEKKYCQDKRPRKAIETARLWAQGRATLEQVRDAADAAYAARAAYISDAAYAAYAAASDAAYAAYAATAADVGWIETQKQLANVVRDQLRGKVTP
jgi:hypothetical protein